MRISKDFINYVLIYILILGFLVSFQITSDAMMKSNIATRTELHGLDSIIQTNKPNVRNFIEIINSNGISNE